MIFVDIGGIVDHHSMSWSERWFLLILVVELLTITQWVEVRGDFVDIGGIVDHHSMSWSERWFLLILVKLLTITQCIEMRGDFVDIGDGQQFHQYQQKSYLTSTHCVMVNNSTNINKNHLSPQFIEWWSTIPPPISTKITPLFNSLSDGQQFHQYQQTSPLTSTHWVMVNNSTNINKNHLSPELIEWWSTIPPISTKITPHFNSSNDGQQFHQYQQKSPLT